MVQNTTESWAMDNSSWKHWPFSPAHKSQLTLPKKQRSQQTLRGQNVALLHFSHPSFGPKSASSFVDNGSCSFRGEPLSGLSQLLDLCASMGAAWTHLSSPEALRESSEDKHVHEISLTYCFFLWDLLFFCFPLDFRF